jgi:hypothetical protein
VAIINSFTIDIGNVLTPRGDASSTEGLKSVLIGDRNVIGSIDPEQPLEGDTGWVTNGGITKRFANGTIGGLTLDIGTVAGNRLKISAPAAAVQISDETESDREGIATGDVNLEFFTPLDEDVGDKEIRFVHD